MSTRDLHEPPEDKPKETAAERPGSKGRQKEGRAKASPAKRGSGKAGAGKVRASAKPKREGHEPTKGASRPRRRDRTIVVEPESSIPLQEVLGIAILAASIFIFLALASYSREGLVVHTDQRGLGMAATPSGQAHRAAGARGAVLQRAGREGSGAGRVRAEAPPEDRGNVEGPGTGGAPGQRHPNEAAADGARAQGPRRARGNRPVSNLTGVVGAKLADLLLDLFGLSAFSWPLILTIIGLFLVRGRPIPFGVGESVAWVSVVVTVATLLSLWFHPKEVLDHLIGGAIGGWAGEVGRHMFGTVGASVIALAALMVELMVATHLSIARLVAGFHRAVSWVFMKATAVITDSVRATTGALTAHRRRALPAEGPPVDEVQYLPDWDEEVDEDGWFQEEDYEEDDAEPVVARPGAPEEPADAVPTKPRSTTRPEVRSKTSSRDDDPRGTASKEGTPRRQESRTRTLAGLFRRKRTTATGRRTTSAYDLDYDGWTFGDEPAGAPGSKDAQDQGGPSAPSRIEPEPMPEPPDAIPEEPEVLEAEPMATPEPRTRREPGPSPHDEPPARPRGGTSPAQREHRTPSQSARKHRTGSAQPAIIKHEPPRPRMEDVAIQMTEPTNQRSWELPSVSLLQFREHQSFGVDEGMLKAMAKRLEGKLANYGVKGKVESIHPGPVVTMFEFKPDSGVKLSKITGLADDLAMSMEVMRVRIVAPIPGKGVVGIEVPSQVREIVYMKELVADGSFRNTSMHLPLCVGKDIRGYPVVHDLAKMPHLLVAGATGSGKSVLVNALVVSLLYKHTPEQLNLIMVDPKQLEFALYEGIPHLLLPVVTDPKKAAAALKWAVGEMERRYTLMREARVRQLKDYNKWVERQQEQWRMAQERGGFSVDEDDGLPLPEPPEKVPYLVVVIDEFADLMMVASKDVESSVARLAQKARAAGIHLILATQRPSVDVITGIIKANFPARIGLLVAQKEDSRTILGQNGAEHLLGDGDMLLMSPRQNGLTRVHGPLVTDEEIERVCTHWKDQGRPQYKLDILQQEDDGKGKKKNDEPEDELYDEAVALVAEARMASASMLQRRMRIGYNRAARLIEIMERQGVVGPPDGSRAREVLIPPPVDL